MPIELVSTGIGRGGVATSTPGSGSVAAGETSRGVTAAGGFTGFGRSSGKLNRSGRPFVPARPFQERIPVGRPGKEVPPRAMHRGQSAGLPLGLLGIGPLLEQLRQQFHVGCLVVLRVHDLQPHEVAVERLVASPVEVLGPLVDDRAELGCRKLGASPP